MLSNIFDSSRLQNVTTLGLAIENRAPRIGFLQGLKMTRKSPDITEVESLVQATERTDPVCCSICRISDPSAAVQMQIF